MDQEFSIHQVKRSVSLSDTPDFVEDFQIKLLKSKSPAARFALTLSLSSTVINLSKKAIKRTNSHLSNDEIRCRVVELYYGQNAAKGFGLYIKGNTVIQPTEIETALQPVVKALESLGVSYYIGGSVASSVYGIARSTLDVDMISNLKTEHISKLVLLLKDKYYISEELISEAVERSGSFNLIHLESAIKIDVFISKQRPYDQNVKNRIRSESISENEVSHQFYIAAPEDVILAKLEWYRKGGEISERQWNDILGVMRVQGDQLDFEYLHQWAEQIGVEDLWKRVLSNL